MHSALFVAIGTVLGIDPSQIKKATAVAVRNVFSVSYRVAPGIVAARFVSGPKIQAAMPIEWTLSVSRRQRRGWVAKLTGSDPKYTFARSFVDATDIKWRTSGGMESVTFVITEPGFYQDSDDDFFLVSLDQEGQLVWRQCCRDEAYHYLVRGRKSA